MDVDDLGQDYILLCHEQLLKKLYVQPCTLYCEEGWRAKAQSCAAGTHNLWHQPFHIVKSGSVPTFNNRLIVPPSLRQQPRFAKRLRVSRFQKKPRKLSPFVSSAASRPEFLRVENALAPDKGSTSAQTADAADSESFQSSVAANIRFRS